MKHDSTFRLRVAAAAVALCALAPVAARADFTALNSAGQISGTTFTFETLSIGFVDSATNTTTAAAGFTFVDASVPLSGEYIASNNSDGTHVLDILGETLGFDGIVRFRFEDLVEAAGIDYDTSTTLSLIAYDDNGNLINPDGSIQGPDHTRGFFGIASDVGIRELWIHDSAGTFQLDNLRFGAAVVPVPGAWALGVLGLSLVGLVRRKI